MNCRFISIKDIWDKKIEFTIPDIQRGLVWNAAQIEVFWDSLMRNIPIGLFTVAKSSGETILLDGQQRWNAINVAQKNKYGVLWCAILEESSDIKLFNRKYLFRWTTNSHPWGFKWDENEKKSPRLNIYERRQVLKDNGKGENDLFSKPQAGDIVPFPAGKIKMVKVQDLFTKEHEKLSQEEQKIKSELEIIINKPIIPLMGEFAGFVPYEIKKTDTCQQTAEVAPDWIDTFFLRMNSQGTPFDKNELAYSAFKSSLHTIGVVSPRVIFEETAQLLQQKKTADTAQIMLQIMTYFLYQKPLSFSWDAGRVKKFFEDKVCDFNINTTLISIKEAAQYLQKIIENFNSAQEKISILPYHLAKMPYEIIRMALVVILTLKQKITEPEKLLSLMFILWWFCVEDRVNGIRSPLHNATEFIIRECTKDAQVNWENIFAQCLYNQWLILPHTPQTLQRNDMTEELFELRKGKTFNWETGKNFVLLACGKYLIKNFSDITCNNDDNRPWDYDHLLPQKIAKTSKMCWTSGNNVPIALTTNRQKQADLPNEHYPDNNKESQNLLYLIPDKFAYFEDAEKFNEFAFTRYLEMYIEVYKAFYWDSFVKYKLKTNEFAETADKISQTLFEKTSRKYSWYYVSDGRDFLVVDNEDYFRFKFFVLRDSMERCFAVETADFKTFSTYGRRKDAADYIRKGVQWWDDSDIKEGMTDNEAIDWLIAKTGTK